MDIQAEFKKAKCCISQRPLTDCEHMNVIQTDYVATWQYPIMSNVLMKNDYKHAIAYIHDDYAPKKEGDKIPDIKFVIEYRDNEIVYHPVETLQRGPEQFQFRRQTGIFLTSFQEALIRSEFFNTEELHFGGLGDTAAPFSAELLAQTLEDADLIFQHTHEGTEIVIITRTKDQEVVASYLIGCIMKDRYVEEKESRN